MILLLLIFYLRTHVLSQKYEGCFRSSVLDPDLPTLILNRASIPAECIKECRSRYYMFAGLMNGQQCFCGSNYGRKGISTSCTLPCTADPNNYCGSQEAMSIYSTGQKGPSPPRGAQIIHSRSTGLEITWEPPNISNGNIILYTLRAVVIETHASDLLPVVESQVQGGSSNNTILQGLQPGTKYNVSIVATNTQGNSEPAYISGWTLIAPPNKPNIPKVIEQTSTTITVLLSEGSSEYGPVNAYQVFVVQPSIIPPSGPSVTYYNYEKSMELGLGYYITGEFESSEFYKFKKFTVGDGKMIGGYYNAPLNSQMTPRIGLAAISRFQREVQFAYSDSVTNMKSYGINQSNEMDAITIVLCVAIGILGALLIASVVLYFALRRRHEKFRMTKLPEQQELTLQGPLYEVDNLAYIPEDVPERINHYQELKNKVWTIPQNALTINDTIIRRGRFGTVHTGTIEKDGKSFTVAVHNIADRLLKASDKRSMLRELDICIRASPMKYLADLVGTCETQDTLYVVLEMPTQTLKSQLLAARSGNIFPVNQILLIGSMVASALQHLENCKIVHDHLCARSIGICNDWTPKLTGHGISKYALEDLKYTRWTAVECFGNRKKHISGVIWAFGVLLWEMLSMGGTPYSNLTLDSEVEEAVERGIRLPQLLDTPDPLYEVMLSCWHTDSQERPTFAELTRLDTLSICPITAITESYVPELELN
ncbi:PREDICTED: putative tyrosine-protein kinase Wsck [Dufourea novaeangliae]|uniref:Putative tyrosine-protein kinase Wsck n=1 Tax=Dufourea novaeangliae TaxID=178035 RepID=A0A154PET0_DUFNO|nr:PREDICTED: putative tyrosine-protein kinase Wsck [Dufourea novaeangliae]KZC09944.1 Putative tyrosine-protein kinase Wsck [Dufourea novaeangliae]